MKLTEYQKMSKKERSKINILSVCHECDEVIDDSNEDISINIQDDCGKNITFCGSWCHSKFMNF